MRWKKVWGVSVAVTHGIHRSAVWFQWLDGFASDNSRARTNFVGVDDLGGSSRVGDGGAEDENGSQERLVESGIGCVAQARVVGRTLPLARPLPRPMFAPLVC